MYLHTFTWLWSLTSISDSLTAKAIITIKTLFSDIISALMKLTWNTLVKLTWKMKYFYPACYLSCFATFRICNLKKEALYHYLELKSIVITKEMILLPYRRLICLILWMEVFPLLFLFVLLLGCWLVGWFFSFFRFFLLFLLEGFN